MPLSWCHFLLASFTVCDPIGPLWRQRGLSEPPHSIVALFLHFCLFRITSECHSTQVFFFSPRWSSFHKEPLVENNVKLFFSGRPPETVNHFNWLLSMQRSSGSILRSFVHNPMFMTIADNRNEDWLVNWELCLMAELHLHHYNLIQCPRQCGCCTQPVLRPTIPSTLIRELVPKILFQLFHLGQLLPSRLKGTSHLFLGTWP